MKRIFLIVLCCLLSTLAIAEKTDRVIVAYVTSWTRVMPDPFLMTHINYAFGHVNDSFDGVRIDNEDRLRQIVALKKVNPELKVMLSVGGWGSGRFSEMAADKGKRLSFAADCRRVVDEFGLDGIDIDWEYPTQKGPGISCSPDDTGNFTLLMRDIRKAIGQKKLLTIATVANASYIDFKSCVRYLDLVNMMTYDMGNPPRHHSALFSSERSGWVTTEIGVNEHLKAGVPAEKLVMGMPVYGRGPGEFDHMAQWPGRPEPPYSIQWDDQAKVPYLADADGKLVLCYDNPRSLAIKCQYLMDRNLRGAMYWEYGDDNSQLDKVRTIHRSLMLENRGVEAPRRIMVIAEQGTGHQPFVDAAKLWLEGLRDSLNIEFTYVTSMKNVAKGEIGRYHALIQLDYPPYAWSQEAAEDFQRYIDKGQGGYIGFHHATLLGDQFDGYRMWEWFSDFMGGIRFDNYIAPLADGTVCVEDSEHPVMTGVPLTFVVPKDEWYTYDRNPRRNVHVLAHVDEASYNPASDIKMGDHPVIWTNPSKPARNVYFQMGHDPALMSSEAFRTMFLNSILWVLAD